MKFPSPLRLTIFMVFTFITLHSCRRDEAFYHPDPGFSKYIEAYTSGTVSKTAAVRIRLASNISATHPIGEVATADYFDFSPSVKGKTYWIDARTIEFKPAENLDAGETYNVTFQLGQIITTEPKFEEFKFSFKTVQPSFSVTSFGLRSEREQAKMNFTGVLETSDIENETAIEKILTASLEGKKVPVRWQHGSDGKSHNFSIIDITRAIQPQQLIVSWNGKPIKSDSKSSETFEIPAVGDFKVLDILPGSDARQYASVLFSSMIATDQDLTGLITIENHEDITYTINGSEVKLYAQDNFDGNYTIAVNPGIKNIYGDTLPKGFTANVFFENRLPSVAIQGRGNILPNSGELVLPFEAINLNAVDITIIKIYENNIPQFLQTNAISGDEELRRVAVPVVQKTLRLDDDKTLDLRKKQRFSLDIDKFIKTEPGAIYRVTIGFRPEYSLYDCRFESSTQQENDGDMDGEESDYRYSSLSPDDNNDFWQRYDDYYPFGYVWSERDNPCATSYYNRDRWATRNIIASNIGLLAKRGEGNDIMIAAADILTAKPIANIQLEVLDYQNQQLAKANTDNEGLANFHLKNKPSLVIATRNDEKGYLRLDEGSSLPLSRFDVSGEETRSGLKAFVFGERGVWRPGDSIFLNCIVEDKLEKLPEYHPVQLELFNPQGILVKKLIQPNAPGGYNTFRLATDAEAPTGNWLARVKIGGATFEKRVKIETVMPNRLKVNLDFGADATLSKTNPEAGKLTARWLFGAPAQNLQARVDATLYSNESPFPKLAGFDFSNPLNKWTGSSQTIYDGKLNSEGVATVSPVFKEVQNAPGMLRANLLVKVFEPGGNFSIDNISLPFSPYSSYIGLKMPEPKKPWGFLLTGKQQTMQLVNVNEKGFLLSGIQDAEVQLYKIQWRWWWDDSRDDLSNFTQDKYNKLIKTDQVKLNNGKGNWSFSVGEHEWGRYLVLVKDKQSGHIAGKVFYVDSPYWQSRDNMNDPSAAAMLSFTSDKPKYNVGDDITLTIPSSAGGHALISLETGSHVLKNWWVDTDKGQTIVKVKAEKEMAPNIYVNVSLLQPHAQTINDLPIRMYGVLPIIVEDKNTVLKPVIAMAGSVRPETQVSFTVSEQQGKSMYYTVAIVDEGLLDITRFKTPAPHDYFYAKEALGVRSWDLYDYVIGAWGNQLERILTIGGDQESGGPAKPLQANRFKPVVKFLGPFHLNKNENAKHTFTLPQYIGSVRMMVVAAENGNYGAAEKAVTVNKPLMLLATVPRVLGPSENIKIPVTVFATDNRIKDVTVSLQTTPNLQIQDGASQKLHFDKTGEQVVNFNLAVSSSTGPGKIKLQASAGGEKAGYDVELDIRNPNPFVTTVNSKNIEAGEAWSGKASPIGSLNTSEATLEISSIPPVDLGKRLNFLVHYPYGCIEQTTSSVFPQLVLQQLMDLPDYRKAEIDRNIRAGIARLQNFQNIDGGFTYWPGMKESDEWGTNYAGHFLLEAQKRGFNVSEAMMQQWKLYERSKANAWYPSTTNFYGGDLTQAYRLFLLALTNSPEIGAMNRLREFKYISPEAKWRLAAAYKLAGQDNVALQMISGLPVKFEVRKDPGYTYGSDTRDEAMVLETLTLMGRRDKAYAVLQHIAGVLSDEKWLSTQTIAYSLIAIAKYCGVDPSGEKLNAEVTINGRPVAINSNSYLYQQPIEVGNGAVPVTVRNKGKNVLYTRIISSGQPLSGDQAPVKNNPALLSIKVEYFDRNKKPIEISRLTQGTDFLARVTVKNPGARGDYERMALNQVFPSGWEIINSRLLENEGAFKSSEMDYRDIRDDRVYTYFDLTAKEVKTYFVQLNAAYLGKYYLPATYAQDMYDNDVSAGVEGKWVEVVSPQ